KLLEIHSACKGSVTPPSAGRMFAGGVTPPASARLLVDVRGEHANAAQIAVALGEVEPVTHHESGRDVEADVAHIHLDPGRLRLAKQRADLNGCRAAALEVRPQPRQCESGV